MKKATLRLFNAVQIDKKNNKHIIDNNSLERTIKNGYILDPTIEPDDKLLDEIENIVGINGEKANASFHKTWQIIQDTPQEMLWIQAIIHYLTTYGFEEMGVYNKETIYIPHEELELPEIKDDISLIIINAITAGELLDKIIHLGGSGIALMKETLNDIITIIITNKYDDNFVEQIKNRELKALLLDHYGIVPQEPVEFLRHLISKLTDESLLIKNDYLIGKIKESNGKFLDELLKKAPNDLASIFFRFKPLFLAMKSISKNKTFFNRLRKQANKLHKPLPEDYLNNVTAKIKHNELNINTLKRKLEKASIFRKIRLAYALKFRENAGDSIIYRVRNGRGWATDFNWNGDTKQALNIVLNSISHDIRKNVEGKTIYIPANINYTLPATEKQFTGFLPTGSYVSIPKDMIVGIHWFNTDKRIDLDLSMIGESGKTGWDSYYTSEENNVLFSGDMTDAPLPDGASELFYLRQGEQEPKIMMLNFYNFESGDEVETKFLVAHEKPENFNKNYMIDVNNIITSANINITKKQNILGLIANIDGNNRFYFANVSIGNSITSSSNKQSIHVRKFLINSLINSINLKDILIMAGANILEEKPENKYIDLSPQMLDKTTFINLLYPDYRR